MVTSAEIKEWIEAGLPMSQATVTGDGRHFEAYVVSKDFIGKSVLQRHRLIYNILGDKMQSDIHALSLQTLAPDELKR